MEACKRPRQMRTVERMDQSESRGRDPRFVGLQMADHMPGQTRPLTDQGALRHRLLYIILAEVARTGRVCGGDRFGRLGFAGENQLDGIKKPSRSPGRLANRLTYAADTLGDFCRANHL